MNEYIERRFAVDAIADTMAKGFVEDRFILPQELQDLQDDLEMLPAAEVAPVVHGRWNRPIIGGTKRKNPFCYCTNCACPAQPKRMSKYCPNCGAKMDFD